jgi:hypothetical protein
MFSMKDISAKTQTHLTKVYTTLLGCVLACATGMWLNTSFFLNGFLMSLISIILSVYLIIQVSNRVANSETTRLYYLGALAFQLGFLAGPGIHYLAEF